MIDYKRILAKDTSLTCAKKNGVVFEKGYSIDKEWLERNIEKVQKICRTFSSYPDIFLDVIKPSDSEFNLYPYQRMVLRGSVRYRYVYITAPRAFSKSFLMILGFLTLCIFCPGIKLSIVAPGKEQATQLTKDKFNEIFGLFPLLKKELVGGDFFSGKDYINAILENGSTLEVVAALDSTRGRRKHGGIIDEVRDHDGDKLNNIILPLFNVSRRTLLGKLNPYEKKQRIIYITSAGDKFSFAYDKMIETLIQSIISPQDAWVFGCSYKVPLMHNLLDENYLNQIKTSTTYSAESFAKEYLGRWLAGGSDSWFDGELLNKRRIVKTAEHYYHQSQNKRAFYLISVDVAKYSCQTVASVFKVLPKDDKFYCKLVNIKVLGLTEDRKHFEKQAIDLKKMIADYRVKEIVIDGNGIGDGLIDFMIIENSEDGVIYPAYGVKNDTKGHYKTANKYAGEKIIYNIKGNDELNSKIYSNALSRIQSGQVAFLIGETLEKARIQNSATYKKIEKRIEHLLPYELTTRLFAEMLNLKLSPRTRAANIIVLEQKSKSTLKDKFSAVSYGLWRIKELEDEYLNTLKRSKNSARNLIFVD